MTRYEKEERWEGEGLLVIGEAVFDEIIEEVLLELLEYFWMDWYKFYYINGGSFSLSYKLKSDKIVINQVFAV